MSKTIFDTSDATLGQQEYKIQVQGVKNCRINFPGLRFFHIPNRPGDAADGHFKKEMGAMAGASDLLFSWTDADWQNGYQMPGGKLEVGILEVKAKRGRIEPDQNKFMSSFSCIGWRVAVARSCREIHDALKLWGLIPRYEVIIEPDLSTQQQKFQRNFDRYKPQPKDKP